MSCAVKGCRNCRRLSTQDISFHVFPREHTFQKEWLKVLSIDNEGWEWSRNKFICSEHFKADDFFIWSGGRSLRPNSMPSIRIVQDSRLPSPASRTQTSFDTNSIIFDTSKLELPYSSSATSKIDENPVIVIDDSDSEKDNNTSSTVTAVEENESNEREILFSRRREKPIPRSFSDCSSDDMETPMRAKICWSIAKRTVRELKGKVRKLTKNKRHLAQKVECLKSLMRYLEENNFLNQYASAVVKAVLPHKTESRSSP